jgi:hypothetical protein
MSKKAEQLKAAMVRRAAERTAVEEVEAPVEEDPEFLDDEEPDYGVEDYNEEEGAEFLYEAQAQVAQEAGFEGFLTGVDFEDNPFLKDETILEDLDEAEATVLIEGWNAGWQEGCREAWTAEVLIGARKLVETGSAEDAEALLGRLTEAVGVLNDFIDFEAYEAFWLGEDE